METVYRALNDAIARLAESAVRGADSANEDGVGRIVIIDRIRAPGVLSCPEIKLSDSCQARIRCRPRGIFDFRWVWVQCKQSIGQQRVRPLKERNCAKRNRSVVF